MRRVLLHPPTRWAGSLGDQALVRGWLSLVPDVDLYMPPPFVEAWSGLGMSVVESPRWRDYRAAVLIGADCIDGAYGRFPFDDAFVLDARRRDVPTRVVSFSMSETSDPEALKMLRRWHAAGTRFYARDVASAQRFRRRVGTVRKAGDLAFLIGAQSAPADVQAFATQAMQSGGTTVALCASPAGVARDGVQATADAIAQVPRPHVIVVSHDTREGGDLAAGLSVMQTLPDVPRVLVEPSTCEQVRGIVRLARVAISHRLHFAIACLAERVPAAVVSYVGKMAGIFQVAGVPELVASAAQDLPGVVSAALVRLESLVAALESGVPEAQRMARLNAEGLA